MDSVDRAVVEELVIAGYTFNQISEALQQKYPNITRGLSARSVRRYCKDNGIERLSGSSLDAVVADAVEEVGDEYGRTLMKGYLSSQGVFAGERRLVESMKRVSPEGYEARRQSSHDHTNPIPYTAYYFGHKLHIDQNEKLIRYGATHVLAIDGFSSKIVAFTTMPIKNNLVIYSEIYRPSLIQFGVWDQLRVDHGREFYLMLHTHGRLREHCGRSDIQAYMQTPSTNNLTVERIWVYINQRVNYPIKRHLCKLEDDGLIDINDEHFKFSISTVTINTAKVGMERFVSSWNSHCVSGKGIPNVLSQDRSNISILASSLIPTLSEAVQSYEEHQGVLTHRSPFGLDMLEEREDLKVQRNQLLLQHCQSYEAIFTDVASGDGQLFISAIDKFHELSRRLSSFI